MVATVGLLVVLNLDFWILEHTLTITMLGLVCPELVEMLSETMEKSVVGTEYDEEGNQSVAVYSGRHDSKIEVLIAKNPHPTPFGPYHMYKVRCLAFYLTFSN
jgi:hypothetical protein